LHLTALRRRSWLLRGALLLPGRRLLRLGGRRLRTLRRLGRRLLRRLGPLRPLLAFLFLFLQSLFALLLGLGLGGRWRRLRENDGLLRRLGKRQPGDEDERQQ
jgi:hypothetical protein